MKSLFALSAFTLVVSTQAALADAGGDSCAVDPHERARQLLLHPTPEWTGSGESTDAAVPAPADPHELARLRLAPRSEAYAASRPADMTSGRPEVDPHERARSLMLSTIQPSESTDSPSEPLLVAEYSPIGATRCEVARIRR